MCYLCWSEIQDRCHHRTYFKNSTIHNAKNVKKKKKRRFFSESWNLIKPRLHMMMSYKMALQDDNHCRTNLAQDPMEKIFLLFLSEICWHQCPCMQGWGQLHTKVINYFSITCWFLQLNYNYNYINFEM